jgi:hypothetical protein
LLSGSAASEEALLSVGDVPQDTVATHTILFPLLMQPPKHYFDRQLAALGPAAGPVAEALAERRAHVDSESGAQAADAIPHSPFSTPKTGARRAGAAPGSPGGLSVSPRSRYSPARSAALAAPSSPVMLSPTALGRFLSSIKPGMLASMYSVAVVHQMPPLMLHRTIHRPLRRRARQSQQVVLRRGDLRV